MRKRGWSRGDRWAGDASLDRGAGGDCGAGGDGSRDGGAGGDRGAGGDDSRDGGVKEIGCSSLRGGGGELGALKT